MEEWWRLWIKLPEAKVNPKENPHSLTHLKNLLVAFLLIADTQNFIWVTVIVKYSALTMPNEKAMKLAGSHCILWLPPISGRKGKSAECNKKTQVKYYTNNITPRQEVLWEECIWPPGTAACWGKQMSQEMMVTSDSLKKPLAMLPKSPLTQLTAVWKILQI